MRNNKELFDQIDQAYLAYVYAVENGNADQEDRLDEAHKLLGKALFIEEEYYKS